MKRLLSGFVAVVPQGTQRFLLVILLFVSSKLFSQGWTSQTSGTTEHLESVHFLDVNTGWAVGGNGTILKTTNGGTSWTRQTSGTSRVLLTVHFIDSNTGWAVGLDGTILRTTNGGTNWARQNSGTTFHLNSVDFADMNTGWVVGFGGQILKTTNGGTTWREQTSPTSNTLWSVDFVDINTGWAVGIEGTILKTVNGGTNWTTQATGTTNSLESVHFLDTNTGWAAGGDGTLLKTMNGGTNWTTQTRVTAEWLNSIYFVDTDTGWAVGNNGTILKTTNGGTDWNYQISRTPNNLLAVAFVDGNLGWAVGYEGTILNTTVGGGVQVSVQNITFHSSSLAADRNVQVYLPPGYDPSDTSVRYPVIYFLHDAGFDHLAFYGFLISTLNELIFDQIVQPVIVVKPDGSAPPYAGSFYTNSALYGMFENYLVYDLVSYIDGAYNTIRDKDKRSIMGHGMGAYGAMKAALKHPDIYGGVAAHSGPLDFNQLPTSGWRTGILAENGGAGPFDPEAGFLSYALFTAAGAFSPNLANAPHPVDLPIDNSGNIVDSTFAKWLLHSPSHLAANLPIDSSLAIYFDCGTDDGYFLFPFNTAFADSLDRFGLKYEFQSYTGRHSNLIDTRFPISLAFLDSVMSVMPTSVARLDQSDKMPQSITVYQSFPNPLHASASNLETTIRFQLHQTGNVTLQIYNINGQLIRTLVSNKHHPVGFYQAHWDMKDDKGEAVTNGIYFYVMQSGNYQQTRKILFLK